MSRVGEKYEVWKGGGGINIVFGQLYTPLGFPGEQSHRIGATFKKFVVKTTFKLKNNHKEESFKLQIYPMKPSAGLSNLVRLSLLTTGIRRYNAARAYFLQPFRSAKQRWPEPGLLQQQWTLRSLWLGWSCRPKVGMSSFNYRLPVLQVWEHTQLEITTIRNKKIDFAEHSSCN
jgi:hypothetical protein